MSAARWTRPVAACAAALAGLLLAGTAPAAPDDDYKEALRLYHLGDVVGAMGRLKPAADGGHAPSMALLAYMYDQSGFSDQAFALYERAAEMGDAEAQYGLANMLIGGRGSKRDEARGVALMEAAARSGHALSINALAQAYMTGTLGRTQASAAAPEGLVWIEKSAAIGFLPALDFLAEGWRSGALGAPDPKKADGYQKQADQLRYQGKPPPKKRK